MGRTIILSQLSTLIAKAKILRQMMPKKLHSQIRSRSAASAADFLSVERIQIKFFLNSRMRP
jgi:hypothetical protein